MLEIMFKVLKKSPSLGPSEGASGPSRGSFVDVFVRRLGQACDFGRFFDDFGRFFGLQNVISSLGFLAFQLSLAARIQRSAERAYFKKHGKHTIKVNVFTG